MSTFWGEIGAAMTNPGGQVKSSVIKVPSSKERFNADAEAPGRVRWLSYLDGELWGWSGSLVRRSPSGSHRSFENENGKPLHIPLHVTHFT